MTTSEVRSPRARAPIHRWLFLLSALAGCSTVPAATGDTLEGENSGTGTDTQSGGAQGEDDSASADEDDAAPDDVGDADPDDGDVDEPGVPDDGVGGEDCAEEAAAAQSVLDQRCVSCHGNGENDGGFANAERLDLVVARGLIVLGNLGASEIYEVTESGEMPLGSSNLSAAELDALEAFILCVPDEDEDLPPVDDGNVGGGDDDDDDEEVEDDDDDVDEDADEDVDEQADEDAEAAEEAAEDDDDD